MKNIDILYVIGDLNLGGTEKHLISILPLLKRKGYKIVVYAFKKKGTLAYKLENENIVIKTMIFSETFSNFHPMLRKIICLPITIVNLYFIIKLYKPKILHMFLPEAYYIGSTASFFNGNLIKIMSRRSKNYFLKNNFSSLLLEKIFHKRTNYILANSESVKIDLISECKNKDKIKLIYNGVKLQKKNKFNLSIMKFKDLRNKFGIPMNDIIICVVANLIPYKNHKLIIEAAYKIKETSTHSFKILFIGQDRGIKNNLIMKINECNLEDNFIFFENITNVKEILLISDISVLCSLHEGFSNAILESMAIGLPIIASNVGGNAEAIIHDYNGYLFDLSKPNNFYEYLINLINDNKLRVLFGKNSIKIVEEKFNIDYCVESYFEIYSKI